MDTGATNVKTNMHVLVQLKPQSIPNVVPIKFNEMWAKHSA